MVASVKTLLISVDFGSALKDMRTDTENLCFWSLGQHRPCLTHHSKTNMWQSSFPRPVVPILLRCSQSSQCDMGLWKWMVIWARDLGSRSQAGVVGEYGSHSLIRWCGSGWEILYSGGPSDVSYCQPSPVPPQHMTAMLMCL